MTRWCAARHHEAYQPLDNWGGDVHIGEANDDPTGEGCLKILLHVGDESSRAVVAALDPDAAFDLDQGATGGVSEVGPPTPALVESVFAFEGWAAEGCPVESELCFKL